MTHWTDGTMDESRDSDRERRIAQREVNRCVLWLNNEANRIDRATGSPEIGDRLRDQAIRMTKVVRWFQDQE